MRNLLTDPAWQAQDLGLPLPVDPHAVSVALPLWEHVTGYEENDPSVVEKMQCGYPRFFLHPLVQKLASEAERDLGAEGESAWLFPSPKAAQRACSFAGAGARVCSWRSDLAVVLTSPDATTRGKLAWRFLGEGISSRHAEAILQGRETPAAPAALRWLQEDLARRTGQQPEDVFLFPSGIAATAAAHRIVRSLRPGLPSLQVDFPYVDVLKIQESWGAEVTMIDTSDPRALESFDPAAVSALFAEIPSNPQLRTPPLAALAARLASHPVPIVADDTIATFTNVDVYPYADLVTTSLTKFYSGAGNVLAGSLILKRSSPFYNELRASLLEDSACGLFPDDARILAANARDFDARIAQINATSETVFDFLQSHPQIEWVWYPKGTTRPEYDAIRRPGGGYGGLLSFLVRQPARRAPRLYDALRLCKGPSLGANFSLLCPYMLLAHYPELDWTDGLGIDRHLLRLSIGLEPAPDLIARLRQALDG